MGEKLEDLQRFDPERMVSRILGMGDIVTLAEKAQETIDEEEARVWEKKWKRAEIDLEDFQNRSDSCARSVLGVDRGDAPPGSSRSG